MSVRLVPVVPMDLPIIAAPSQTPGIVRPPGVFPQPIDRVQSEAVDTAVDPEADDIEDRLTHGGIGSVQIRLLR